MTTAAPPFPTRRVVVRPLRSHGTFEAVRRTPHRGRSGPVAVSFVEQPSRSERQVAYAVSRRVGNAVVRNRMRRRMRAIMAGEAASLPEGAYVIHVGPGGPALGHHELQTAMVRALAKATAGRPTTGTAR